MYLNLTQCSQRFLSLPLLVRVLLSILVVSAIVVLTQNFQIFPGAVMGLSQSTTRDSASLPEGVSSHFVATSDNALLELWHLPVSEAKATALIFHGNAGDVENFFPYQLYFKKLGISSYNFDYRGYGKSTGWPSEDGLYKDADAVYQFLSRQGVEPNELIVVGVSIGSGPASYLASKVNPKISLYFSPYTSLPEVIADTPIFGFLSIFSWYEFPVASNVAMLRSSCLVVAHGEQDTVIPVKHGRAVFDNYRGNPNSQLILSPQSGHNDVLFKAAADVKAALTKCGV